VRIEKQFTVASPRADVWRFITDPAAVAPCVPGCAGVTQSVPGKYAATIKLQIGPIHTSFDVQIEALEQVAPERAVYSTAGDEGGKASRVKAQTTLVLREVSAAVTEVSYVTEVNIVGRLGKFGAGLVQKKADAIGAEFAAALCSRIEGRGAAPASNVTDAPTDAVSDPATTAGGGSRWLWVAAAALVVAAAAYFAVRA
jgi:uncharacterized protein